MSAPITLFTTDSCPYCEQAKNLLRQKKIEFSEILVSRQDHDKRAELYARSKMKTFPQIWYGEELIGGYTELAALSEEHPLWKNNN